MVLALRSQVMPPESVQAGETISILGCDDENETLVGTGTYALVGDGCPNRVVHVEFIDPESGQTWLGSTRDWELRNGVWHWVLNLSSATNTEQPRNLFMLESREIWTVAYYDEPASGAGPRRVVSARPYILKRAPDATSCELRGAAKLGPIDFDIVDNFVF